MDKIVGRVLGQVYDDRTKGNPHSIQWSGIQISRDLDRLHLQCKKYPMIVKVQFPIPTKSLSILGDADIPL